MSAPGTAWLVLQICCSMFNLRDLLASRPVFGVLTLLICCCWISISDLALSRHIPVFHYSVDGQQNSHFSRHYCLIINPVKGNVSDSELNGEGGHFDTTPEIYERVPLHLKVVLQPIEVMIT